MTEETPDIITLLRSAALLRPERALKPEPGDWIVDITRGCPGTSYVGRLEAIELDAQDEPVYRVTTLSAGLVELWENTVIVTVKPAKKSA